MERVTDGPANQIRQYLLAQRACVDFYPPVLNQAALLGERGEVTVVDTGQSGPVPSRVTPGVRRLKIAIRDGRVPRRVRLLQTLWLFAHEFRRELSKDPAAVIAYDTDAAFLLLRGKCSKRVLRIVHLHELPSRDYFTTKGFSLFAKNYAMRHLHRADLVVMPDAHRANIVQEECGLQKRPLIVMNCPRRLESLPPSRLLPYLRKRRVPTDKIVHYQGTVSSDHNLARVIESMRWWPPDAVFVIVGGDEHRLAPLRDTAQAAGVADRVAFVGRVPYEEVFSYAVGASVGVTFLRGWHPQWKYSAGASNKRFEYVALGIPQVTNPLPGVHELFESNGVARIAAYDDAEAIGHAISSYLEDEAARRQVFERARTLHLEEYNYEFQIEPLIQFIEDPGSTS